MPLDVSRIRAVLFDVDGTLADTDDEYIRRAGKLMRHLSFLFPQRDPTNFLRWSLMTAETPMNLLMGMPDWLGVDDELAGFFDWVAERRARAPETSPAEAAATTPEVPGEVAPVTPGALRTSGHFVLMAGVGAMLARLSERHPLGVVTARGERATQSFLDQFGLGGRFRVVASAQTAAHTKPYPDPVLWCARELGLPVETCLMVGDTTVDILAGKRAGAQTVGVLCGFGHRAELERAGATAILAQTAELGDALGVP